MTPGEGRGRGEGGEREGRGREGRERGRGREREREGERERGRGRGRRVHLYSVTRTLDRANSEHLWAVHAGLSLMHYAYTLIHVNER